MANAVVVYEKDYSRYTVVSAILETSKGAFEEKHIVAGRYFMVSEIRNTYLYKQYEETSERCCLSSFRLYLEKSNKFSLEEMISLIKEEKYNMAGLIFLAWMREEYCFGPINSNVSIVTMDADDWTRVLNVLTNNKNIRIQ